MIELFLIGAVTSIGIIIIASLLMTVKYAIMGESTPHHASLYTWQDHLCSLGAFSWIVIGLIMCILFFVAAMSGFGWIVKTIVGL